LDRERNTLIAPERVWLLGSPPNEKFGDPQAADCRRDGDGRCNDRKLAEYV